ncbi:MAG: hypothetical protein H7Y38_09340, partial [Armatimonadetes bacterium]|nr:hypothetical protein [Armatimonadota bacterium]
QIALFDSYLKVTSDPLIRTAVDSNNGENTNTTRRNRFRNYLTTPNTYIIDYGDDGGAWVMFPPSVKTRIYTISYSYEVGRDSAGTDPDEVGVQSPVEITIPASPALVDDTTPSQYVWYKLAPGTFPNITGPVADGDAIQPNTDIVVRNFARLAGDNPTTAPVEGTAWDATDPYQYKLISANVAPSANLGVVAFNPVGANYSVSVPGGVKPFTALVSYAVLDWHIMRDDREVPVGGVVRTTLPNIRPREDETTDLSAPVANRTQIYPGLYPQGVTYNTVASLPSIAQSPDIQVFNLSDASGTAKLLNSYDAADPGSTPGDYANFATDTALAVDQQPYFWINRSRTGGTYPTGGIYINTNRVPVGSKVRILYKAQGNWAVAFQKAAKTYRFQEATGGQLPVANNANVFAISRNGTPTDFTDDRVVFHRTELNKGVTATVEITTGSGNTRRITRLPVRQFSIQNADGQYAFANLSDIATELKNAAYNGGSITGTRIVGNIAGASLKTRVVWQDDPNGRAKYRVSDLETFVSRQAQ